MKLKHEYVLLIFVNMLVFLIVEGESEMSTNITSMSVLPRQIKKLGLIVSVLTQLKFGFVNNSDRRRLAAMNFSRSNAN